jgi:hypothetical protein
LETAFADELLPASLDVAAISVAVGTDNAVAADTAIADSNVVNVRLDMVPSAGRF